MIPKNEIVPLDQNIYHIFGVYDRTISFLGITEFLSRLSRVILTYNFLLPETFWKSIFEYFPTSKEADHDFGDLHVAIGKIWAKNIILRPQVDAAPSRFGRIN